MAVVVVGGTVIVGHRAMIEDRVMVGCKKSQSGCPASLGCSLAVEHYCSKADQEVVHS